LNWESGIGNSRAIGDSIAVKKQRSWLSQILEDRELLDCAFTVKYRKLTGHIRADMKFCRPRQAQ